MHVTLRAFKDFGFQAIFLNIGLISVSILLATAPSCKMAWCQCLPLGRCNCVYSCFAQLLNVAGCKNISWNIRGRDISLVDADQQSILHKVGSGPPLQHLVLRTRSWTNHRRSCILWLPEDHACFTSRMEDHVHRSWDGHYIDWSSYHRHTT